MNAMENMMNINFFKLNKLSFRKFATTFKLSLENDLKRSYFGSVLLLNRLYEKFWLGIQKY